MDSEKMENYIPMDSFETYLVDNVRQITHDSVVIRVDLAGKVSGIKAIAAVAIQPSTDFIEGTYSEKMKGSKTFLKLSKKGKLLKAKPYTPISLDNEAGYMDLLVKVYEEGRVSGFVGTLKIGDKIDIKRRKQKWIFDKECKNRSDNADTLVLICGGTGIAPIFQILKQYHIERKVNGVKRDDFKLKNLVLVYSNKTEEDILLRAEIDKIANDLETGEVRVHHTLTRETSEKWDGLKGRVSKKIMEIALTGKEGQAMDDLDRYVFVVCGTKGFYETVCGGRRDKAVSGILSDLGFDDMKRISKI